MQKGLVGPKESFVCNIPIAISTDIPEHIPEIPDLDIVHCWSKVRLKVVSVGVT